MKLIGIDIGKNKHFFCIMDQQTGEIVSLPVSFSNDKEGFDFLLQKIKSYQKESVLIGMEDTGHYHFALLKYLLDLQYTVALINPKTTDFNRKMQGGITKNDKLDTINICDVLDALIVCRTKTNQIDQQIQHQRSKGHHNDAGQHAHPMAQGEFFQASHDCPPFFLARYSFGVQPHIFLNM